MKDLSLHILDIAENSIRAGAKNVLIEIEEEEGVMTLTIVDDGAGMTEEEVRRALDPFHTTKKERGVGLGLPMLKRTAEQCGGRLDIRSAPGMGTVVRAVMVMRHIDFPPMGDLTETMAALMAGNPGVDFSLKYAVDGAEENFSTRNGSPRDENIDCRAPMSIAWPSRAV